MLSILQTLSTQLQKPTQWSIINGSSISQYETSGAIIAVALSEIQVTAGQHLASRKQIQLEQAQHTGAEKCPSLRME